jgi:hypothetical protein
VLVCCGTRKPSNNFNELAAFVADLAPILPPRQFLQQIELLRVDGPEFTAGGHLEVGSDWRPSSCGRDPWLSVLGQSHQYGF